MWYVLFGDDKMELHQLVKAIENVSIFKDMQADCLKVIFETTKYHVKRYSKNDILAIEGDVCGHIGIILAGEVELKKEFPAGHTMTLTFLESGDTFGEVIVFSQAKAYQATIVAISPVEVLYISEADVLDLLERCESVLKNFLTLLSNKILFLNKKTSILSFRSIEEKVASFFLEFYKQQKNMNLNIPMSRKEMAAFLNVPRPSLSRTMAHLKDKEIIDYYQNTIRILDLKALEDCLF